MRMGRWVIGVVLLGLIACGSADTTVPVTVQFPKLTKSVLTSLSSVTLAVTASDMTTVSSSQTGPFSSDVSFSVDVPTGNSRTFTATAAITGSSTVGYQGTSTTNVSTSTASVPLTMLFVNFANNSASAVTSGPQITSVSTSYSPTGSGNVVLTVGFGSTISIEQTALIIEFIPASGGTARSQSMINQAKGSVDVTMPSAGTRNIIVNGLGAGTLDAILYDANDQSVSSSITASTTGSNIVVSMSETQFMSLIDANINGKLNILAGSKTSGTEVITPTNLSSFTASSAAVNTSGGNVMIYNENFVP